MSNPTRVKLGTTNPSIAPSTSSAALIIGTEVCGPSSGSEARRDLTVEPVVAVGDRCPTPCGYFGEMVIVCGHAVTVALPWKSVSSRPGSHRELGLMSR